MRLAYLVFLVLSVAAFGSANIQTELQDFYDILPKFRISYIIAKHYIFDGDFRTGFNYLKSSSFQKLVKQEFATSPELQQISDFLGYPIDVNFIQKNMRSLSIPMGSPEDFAHERTFTSFVDEVVDYLPHDKFKDLIGKKIATSSEFRQLYQKIMDPQFKTLVYQARNSESLAGAIKTLKNNEIDVDHMLRLAFQLLQRWRQ